MSAIAISRMIGSVSVDCILRERPSHKLGITRVPIETGSAITDHAYMNPKQIELEFADKNAAATFAALVRLQESRVPFTLVSGLYVYRNMLVEEISPERDAETSRILRGRALISEAIIVSTAAAAGSSQKGAGQASNPTKERAGNSTTADRASGTVARGDTVTSDVTPEVQGRVRSSFA